MKSISKLILLVNRMINQVLFLSFIGLGSSITLYADISPKVAVVYPNQTVTFSCESNGGYTYWEVNGTNHNNLELEMRHDMMKDADEKTLTINNPYKYNTSNVTCITQLTFASQKRFGSTALLLVQGVLSAVTELSCTNSSSDIITVMWTAPFSLNVTESDPGIWYSVAIYNVTDANNPTLVLCINITDIQYTFITEYFNQSHQYNITVTTNNKAGQGESSIIVCPNMTSNGTSEQRRLATNESLASDIFSNESSQNDTGKNNSSHIVHDDRRYYLGCLIIILPLFGLLIIGTVWCKCVRNVNKEDSKLQTKHIGLSYAWMSRKSMKRGVIEEDSVRRSSKSLQSNIRKRGKF